MIDSTDKENLDSDAEFLEDVIDLMEINGIEFPKSNPNK
jgi:hypothetical protein